MSISKEGTIQCYNLVAPLYSFFRNKTHRADDEIMPFVLDVLDPRGGEHILDAGTGPGIYAIKLAQMDRDTRIHAVDLSPKFLQIAEKNAGEAGIGHIAFSQGDLENLPFDDNHFDKLVCAGAISAVPDKGQAATELYRVLKPGGKAVITEPHNGKLLNDKAFLFLLYVLGLFNPNLRGFSAKDLSQYYFTRNSFHDLFAEAGFESVGIVERRGSLCAVCSK